MALDLCNYEQKAQAAIKAFWKSRDDARLKQHAAGRSDQGERASVTGGNNLNDFAELVADVVRANGLPHAEIHRQRKLLTLPGFFRPSKLWDLLVMDRGRLIAALEFKSHVGPLFSNNFNNRAEEAIGTSHDFWTAYRDGAFGRQARPFVGWLMVVEDAEKSRAPVRESSTHFKVFPEFAESSYLQRYDTLCGKLVSEQLYSAAAVIATPQTAVDTGAYSELSELTGLRSFLVTLAGHVAAEAAK